MQKYKDEHITESKMKPESNPHHQIKLKTRNNVYQLRSTEQIRPCSNLPCHPLITTHATPGRHRAFLTHTIPSPSYFISDNDTLRHLWHFPPLLQQKHVCFLWRHFSLICPGFQLVLAVTSVIGFYEHTRTHSTLTKILILMNVFCLCP